MDYFEEFEFKTPKQQRSIKALEDIMQAMEQLAQSQELEGITTQDLSDRSGYAQGTIFHHFKKFDNIFVYIFLIRQKKGLSKIIDIIINHPIDQPLSVLANNIITQFFNELSTPPRSALIFCHDQLLKNTKYPQLIHSASDTLIPFWMNACLKDETNTFFNFSEFEVKLKLRAIQTVVRTPFFEDDPIAGTAEHKDMVVRFFIQLFPAP